jgi:hypothetical protein
MLGSRERCAGQHSLEAVKVHGQTQTTTAAGTARGHGPGRLRNSARGRAPRLVRRAVRVQKVMAIRQQGLVMCGRLEWN